jgi:hypothetical protein
VRRVAALIAYVGRPTRDGRTIDEVTVEPGQLVPVFDGRPNAGTRQWLGRRDLIGQAYIYLEGETGADVVARCTLYDDAVAALLAPDSPYRLVADLRGEVKDEDEDRIRSFTEPETRPYPKWRMVGEVGAVTLTHAPAWDDLWVREES